jgi:carbon starvation protein
VFGASNQMIAALTLLVMALYFWQRQRPVLPLVLPMLFVMAVTMFSLGLHLLGFMAAQQWLLVSVTVVLTSLLLWMSVESLGLFVRLLRERKQRETPR